MHACRSTLEDPTVALSLSANPGSTWLGGTVYVALQNGVATFSATRINVAGTGYSLRAQSTGLTDATSTTFDVVWGEPSATYSTVTVVPPSVEANGIDTTQVTFRVANAYDVAIPGAQASLAVSGSNNVLAPMSGTTSNQGTLVATLSSTTVETKTVTGSAGQITASGTVQFFAASCRPLLPGAPSTPYDDFASAFHVVDVDGDGDRDVIVAITQDQEIDVFLNGGAGTFASPIRIPVTGTTIEDIDAADFNADGDIDLVVSLSGTTALTVLLGNGTGQFPTTMTTALASDPDNLAVADVNGDSKADVIVFVPGVQKVFAALGVGNGTFTPGAGFTGGFRTIAVVDANKDGALDLLLAGDSSVAIVRGVGNGTFLPLSEIATTGGVVLTGDFNADTKLDMATADFSGVLTPYLGNGDGTFNASTNVAYRGVRQPMSASGGGVLDLDADGKLDIVVGAGLTTSVLKGSGTGTFTRTRTYYAATEFVAEMTGDGDLDLVGRAGFTVAVSAGTTGAAFVAPTELLQNQAFNSWLYDATADFDKNGRADYVRWRSGSLDAMSVLRTLADGSIVEATTAAATPDPYDAVAGDFTGDGNPDVVIVDGAVTGVDLRLATGNGTGALSAFSSQNIASPYATRLEVGDFNGDGKQDLVLSWPGNAGVSIALSTGSGFAAPVTYPSPIVSSVRVRDVSGDGVPDVTVHGGSGFSAEVRVYIATGTGTLMPAVSYATGGLTGAIGVGDLTSDGIVDLVFLHGDFLATPRAVYVYPGLGAGGFGPPRITPNVRIPDHLDYETMNVADVTNDSDPDLIVHSTYGTTVIPSFGDGYVRQTPLHYAAGFAGGTTMDPVVMIDHDENGRPDFVFWDVGLVLATNAGCVP